MTTTCPHGFALTVFLGTVLLGGIAAADVIDIQPDPTTGDGAQALRLAWTSAQDGDTIRMAPGMYDLGGAPLAASVPDRRLVIVGDPLGTQVRGLAFPSPAAGQAVLLKSIALVDGLTFGSGLPETAEASAANVFFVFEDMHLVNVRGNGEDAVFSRCTLTGSVLLPGPSCGALCGATMLPALDLGNSFVGMYDCELFGASYCFFPEPSSGFAARLSTGSDLVLVNTVVLGGEVPAGSCSGGTSGSSAIELAAGAGLIQRGGMILAGQTPASAPPPPISNLGGSFAMLPSQPSGHWVSPDSVSGGQPVTITSSADPTELVFMAFGLVPTSDAKLDFYGVPALDQPNSNLMVIGRADASGSISKQVVTPQVPLGAPGLTVYSQSFSLDPQDGYFAGATAFLQIVP